MNKGSILFLKGAILVVALGALVALILFPPAEGRAADLGLVAIYADPLIIYAYVASIPFFVGLYQAFKLLSSIDNKTAFSQATITRLRKIRLASLSLIGLILLALVYIRFFTQGDDPARPTMLGLCMSLLFGLIATVATVFQRVVQKAVDLQVEHDLTV